MSNDYIPDNDLEFLQKLEIFDANIGSHASDVRFIADQLESHTADTNSFRHAVRCAETMKNGGTEWIAWRNILRKGGDHGTAQPVAPVLPPAPPAVLPGIEQRFRALVNQAKASPKYNEAIGKALGIVTETLTPPDLLRVKPSLLAMRDGDNVRIKWGWGGNRGPLEMCEIHVDRNDGKGFVPLAYDTTPNYVDTMEQPPAPVVWTYKAIYRANDQKVGQWSDLVTITVGG